MQKKTKNEKRKTTNKIKNCLYSKSRLISGASREKMLTNSRREPANRLRNL